MLQITLFENNDPRQTKILRAKTEDALIANIVRWSTSGTFKDFCLGFDADCQPTYSLNYSESYKDFEIREHAYDVDSMPFDHYIDALNAMVDYIKPRIEK